MIHRSRLGRLGSRAVATLFTERMKASCLTLFLSASGLGSLRGPSGIPATDGWPSQVQTFVPLARSFGRSTSTASITAVVRWPSAGRSALGRPGSARSLRCGLRFLVPRALRLPSARSLRPGGSGVGHRSFLADPSVPDPPGGIQPPGFIMRRHPCRRRSGRHLRGRVRGRPNVCRCADANPFASCDGIIPSLRVASRPGSLRFNRRIDCFRYRTPLITSGNIARARRLALRHQPRFRRGGQSIASVTSLPRRLNNRCGE